MLNPEIAELNVYVVPTGFVGKKSNSICAWDVPLEYTVNPVLPAVTVTSTPEPPTLLNDRGEE
jgi:hypothetical protein